MIKEIFESPNDDFIKFVIKERFKFKVTQQFINTSRPLIVKSIQEAISEVISENLILIHHDLLKRLLLLAYRILQKKRKRFTTLRMKLTH